MGAASRSERAGRTLVAGVGYLYLRDGSVGPLLAERLAREVWPERVSVEDYGFGAIDAVHRLRDGAFDQAVFFGSVGRGEAPGTVRRYAWGGRQADAREVQARVAEAAQAVIDLEGMLVVCAHFQALPARTVVLEMEPGDLGFGDGFTPEVAQSLPKLAAMIRLELEGVAR